LLKRGVTKNMPKYEVQIKSPGRGLRIVYVIANSSAKVRINAKKYLETGSKVKITRVGK
jgi:hypothetical protein